MGYILLNTQLNALNKLIEKLGEIDRVELLWIPGGIMVTVWLLALGPAQVYTIDDFGATNPVNI